VNVAETLGAARSEAQATPGRTLRSGAFLAICLAGLLAIALVHITQGAANLSAPTVVEAIVAPQDITSHNIVRYVRLPRVAIGILAGAALGMAGALLQAVTRNPLASPTTLGVNAGAYLALVAATIFAPWLFGLSSFTVAFAGGLLAAGLVYTIAAGVDLSPMRLALAGVAVSIALGAITATLQILFESETSGLFFWGAGSLVQNDWSNSAATWPRVLVPAVLALLLARAFDVLSLGDDVARSLGQRVQTVRFGGAALGVLLAAAAVTAVGPISFVGLVVPHLVRLVGFTRHLPLLAGSAVLGACLLLGADVLARLVRGNMTTIEAPVGWVTALVGTPFLVWLTRRAARASSAGQPPRPKPLLLGASRTLPYPWLVGAGAVALFVAFAAGVMLGDTVLRPDQVGAALTRNGTPLLERIIFELRLPRLLVALLAGAALAVSGLLIQGVVRNSLAGPEIVGVTSGAGLGALTAIVLLPFAPIEVVPIAAFVGAVATFSVVYAAAWQASGISPARLALVGIAISALCLAAINLLVVMAQVRVAQALVWIAGSTYARGWEEVVRLVAWPVVLLPVAWLVARWLDLLALGDDVARGLGVRLEAARGTLLAVALALAASAVATVGTIGFVGLIAPHAARILVGGQHRKLVPVTALLGATLVVAADTVGRSLVPPREIPSGLVTALVGTPYFVWLLWASRVRTTR
jgi:ferric hydroxamate transport system permease protein